MSLWIQFAGNIWSQQYTAFCFFSNGTSSAAGKLESPYNLSIAATDKLMHFLRSDLSTFIFIKVSLRRISFLLICISYCMLISLGLPLTSCIMWNSNFLFSLFLRIIHGHFFLVIIFLGKATDLNSTMISGHLIRQWIVDSFVPLEQFHCLHRTTLSYGTYQPTVFTRMTLSDFLSGWLSNLVTPFQLLSHSVNIIMYKYVTYLGSLPVRYSYFANGVAIWFTNFTAKHYCRSGVTNFINWWWGVPIDKFLHLNHTEEELMARTEGSWSRKVWTLKLFKKHICSLSYQPP